MKYLSCFQVFPELWDQVINFNIYFVYLHKLYKSVTLRYYHSRSLLIKYILVSYRRLQLIRFSSHEPKVHCELYQSYFVRRRRSFFCKFFTRKITPPTVYIWFWSNLVYVIIGQMRPSIFSDMKFDDWRLESSRDT